MDRQLASLFESLIEALKDELESHTRLLDFIREETQALRHSRLPEILAAGNKKSEAFWLTAAAAKKREEAIDSLIACLGHKAPVSFAQLAAAADFNIRQILTFYKEKFADIIPKIKKANETNRQIIELTLTQVNNNIRFIQNLTTPLPNYDQQGQIRIDGNQGGIISQAG